MFSWLKRGRRGTNAIEFAITFPFFVFVTAGMIDGAWLVMQQSAYDSAAHLGCRDGSTKDPGFAMASVASVKSYAQSQTLVNLGKYGGQCNSCSVTAEVLYANPATSLRCTITGNYKPLFGVLPAGGLKAKAIVRMEFQR